MSKRGQISCDVQKGSLILWCQKGANYLVMSKKGWIILWCPKRGQLSCDVKRGQLSCDVQRSQLSCDVKRGKLSCDVQNKPFCGSAAGDEYQMAHMVTTKSFASRGWIASVEGSILAIHSDDLPSFVAPFKNKWRACERRSPASKILSGNLISHRIAAVFL